MRSWFAWGVQIFSLRPATLPSSVSKPPGFWPFLGDMGVAMIKAIQEYHASHDCDPGPCVCRCGCKVEMGCRALGGLCSRCHLDYIWDEGDHGFKDQRDGDSER